METTTTQLPKDFIGQYWDSIFQNWETEKVWNNCMIILKRTGNIWRELTFEEYKAERLKDGGFSNSEQPLFEKVLPYTTSAEKAKSFVK